MGYITVLNSTQWGNVASTHPDYMAGSAGRFVRTTFAWDEIVLSSQPIKRMAEQSSTFLAEKMTIEVPFYPIPFDGKTIRVSALYWGSDLFVFDLAGRLVFRQNSVSEVVSFPSEFKEQNYIFQVHKGKTSKSVLVAVK